MLLSLLTSHFSLCFAQGNLTPPGGPAPSMKSLDQIEPRTPISSALFTITQPGSYYLATNVAVLVFNGITIATNGVTLDLNGFTISCNTLAGNAGIMLSSGVRNITILNGFIQGGVTNNGSGVYNGPGFSYGIYYSGTPPANVRVSGVSVSGCLVHGIFLNNVDSTVAESCTVRTVGGAGIYASTIKQSLAIDCGANAVVGGQISDCHGQSSGSGDGINGFNAVNCSGSSATGNGVYAYTALNCYGVTSSGSGVYAPVAQNCYGYTTGGGNALVAFIAQNSYGYANGNGFGVYAYQIASGCYGFSPFGTGLYALIANVCHGETSFGTALSTTHNVNSF